MKPFPITSSLIHYHSSWPLKLLEQFKSSCFVLPDFISDEEEKILLDEVEPHLKRLRYEADHWDHQIVLYREREQEKWSDKNRLIIERMRHASFSNSDRLSPFVHILDLHKEGYIRPHIDATRYCGGTISGISLLSDSVMRLRFNDQELIADLYLKRKSLYKLSDLARYEFKHEILAEKDSYFDGKKVSRERRISFLLREYPKPRTNEDQESKIVVRKLDDLIS